MTTDLFLGGLIVLTMAAVIIVALTQRKGSSSRINDGYDNLRAKNARPRNQDRR